MPIDRIGQFLVVIKGHYICQVAVIAADVVLTDEMIGCLDIDQSEDKRNRKNKENYRFFDNFDIFKEKYRKNADNDN